MPIARPGNLVLVLSDRFARGAVDDHDLPTVGIGLRAEVDIVEVRRILMVEEDAAVAMIASVLRAADAEGENEVTEFDILDESDVVGATNLGLVVVLPRVDAKDVVPVYFAMCPSIRVGQVPALEPVLEVFAKDEGKFAFALVGGKWASGEGGDGDDERNDVLHGL